MNISATVSKGLIALSLLALTACDDENQSNTTANEPDTQAQNTPAAVDQKTAIHQAAQNALSLVLGNILEKYPLIEMGQQAPTLSEAAVQTDGSLLVTASIPVALRESIYDKKDMSAEFNKMRRAINKTANAAMRPDSSYLVQVGTPVQALRDEDRQAKPLPENLLEIEQKLQKMTAGPTYSCAKTKGEEFAVEATIAINPIASPDSITVKAVDLKEDQFAFIDKSIPESELPAEAKDNIVTPEWTESKMQSIAATIKQFEAMAAPYIQSREQSARVLMVERLNEIELKEKQAQEQAALAEQARQEFINTYLDLISDNRLFEGDWKRGSKFGKLSLRIDKAEQLDHSIHFIGSLFDTDLPEARLDITGRCDLANDKEDAKIDINIYDGQYDPDQATAEVYDALDGILTLTLSRDGDLTGTMSCESWRGLEDKEFTVSFSTEKNQNDKED